MTLKKIIYTVFTVCLISNLANAQSIIDRRYISSQTSFPATNIIDITDDRYGELSSGVTTFKDKESYALVSVGFDADMNICFDEAKKFIVTVKAEQTIIATPGTVTSSINFYTLTVNYDPMLQVLETENAFVKINNGRKLILSITEVKSVSTNGTETLVTSPVLLPGNLFVEGELVRERYFNFNPNTVASFTNPPATQIESYLVTDHVHVIQWSNVAGAVEYEVEWTYINDYGPDFLSTTVVPTEPFSFKNNASSVRVKSALVNRIFIPAIYGSGYVVFRVRAIGRGGTNLDEDIFGKWSLSNPTYTMAGIMASSSTSYRKSIPNNVYVSQIQEIYNLNAQFSIQFAEEGKMLASGTFADGTLRTRQNVVAAKVYEGPDYGKKSIISETIYDHMGRAAITTLPAVTKNGLWYTPNYNLDAATLEKFDYTHFDLDDFLSEGCVSNASPMSTTSGASNYYSSANALKGEAQQGLIPDAYRFPYIQTMFEKDNTGRPTVQSGVGDFHKMGSGHETKTMYGGAEQDVLNSLFGTDVGKASYYQKNLVIDPNGQTSISYTDMMGRTIATALSGDVPTNVDPLLGEDELPLAQAGAEITEDLLQKDDNNVNGSSNILSQDGNSYTYSNNLLVSTKQIYHFTYASVMKTFEHDCFQDKCMECVYDLELSIVNDCGEYVVGNGDLTGPLILTFGGGRDLDMLCNESTTFDPLNFSIELEVGSYSIYKKLSINNAAMEYYADQMLLSSSCLLSPQDFYDTPDLSGCDISCDQCKASLGTWEQFFTQDKIDELGGDPVYAEQILSGVYAAMKSDCEAICADESIDYCAATYELMLLDMSPQGQYAEYTEDNGNISTSTFPLSIFNTQNLLPKKYPAQFAVPSAILNEIDNAVPSWRLPVYYDPSSPTVYKKGYYNDNGSRITVHVYKDVNGQYVPKVVNPALVTTIDVVTNSYSTYPENLFYETDFIDIFEPHFAKSLLIWHPEFFHYEWCIESSKLTTVVNGKEVNTHNYDQALSMMNFAEAQTYFGTTAVTDINQLINLFTSTDPFFQSPLASIDLFPGFNATTILDNRLRFFQTLQYGTLPYPVNFAEMSYVTSHCGYDALCIPDLTSPGMMVWSSGTNNLINSDEDWRRLIDFYKASKQYVFGVSQNLYALAGDAPLTSPWTNVNAQCIGDNSYIPIYELIEWAGNPSSLRAENPCNPLTFMLFHNKQRRFQTSASAISESYGLSDPPTVEELQEFNQQAYYQETGNCPMVPEMEYIISRLALKGKLVTTSLPVNLGDGYLGSNMQSYINDHGNLALLNYTSTISGNTLTATTSAVNCNSLFTLTLPPAAVTAGYTFSDITFMSVINNISQGPLYSFDIQAVFIPANAVMPETLTVKGTTCLPLSGCESTFKNICKATPEAKDLLNLFSGLSQGNQLYGTNVNLNVQPYSGLVTPRLKAYLGNGGNYRWTYGTSPNEYFELQNVTNSNTIRLDINGGGNGLNNTALYEFISATSATSVSSSSSFSDFIFTATPVNPTNPNPYQSQDPNAVKVTLAGVVTTTASQTFPVTACNPVTPLQCNTSEHKNLEKLKKNFEVWLAAQISSADYNCLSELKIGGGPFNINSIAEILDVTADMDLSENNLNSNYFRIRVRLTDNSYSYVTGKSCVALRNCETCKDECDLVTFDKIEADLIPGKEYYFHWNCVDFETWITYDQNSVQEFWQEIATRLQIATWGIPNISVVDNALMVSYAKSDITGCDCSEAENTITIDLWDSNRSEANRERVGTYWANCCQDKAPSCVLGSSYLEFTFSDNIGSGYSFEFENDFLSTCTNINPSIYTYQHASTNEFLRDWASEIYVNSGKNINVYGNTIRLNFNAGLMENCPCGSDDIDIQIYDENQNNVASLTSPLFCCEEPAPCQPGSSSLTFSFDPNTISTDHYFELEHLFTKNCIDLNPYQFTYAHASLHAFLVDWASQISSNHPGIINPVVNGNTLQLNFSAGSLAECDCVNSPVTNMKHWDHKGILVDSQNVALICCDITVPCQPGSSYLEYSFNNNIPEGAIFSLERSFHRNCLEIMPESFTYRHSSTNEFLLDWAAAINTSNAGMVNAVVTSNTIRLNFAPGGLECACGENEFTMEGRGDDPFRDPYNWNQTSPLLCCETETSSYCQPGGAYIRYVYNGTGNANGEDHTFVLSGDIQKCYPIDPKLAQWDGTISFNAFLANWAAQINSNHNPQIQAVANGNALELYYTHADNPIDGCQCEDNSIGELSQYDQYEGDRILLWTTSSNLSCCSSPCTNSSGGFVQMAVIPNNTSYTQEIGDYFQLSGSIAQCLGINPDDAEYISSTSLSTLLYTWAAQINANHTGSIVATASGNNMTLLFSSSAIDDRCPCSSGQSLDLTLYNSNGNIKDTWSFNMSCCQAPQSRSVNNKGVLPQSRSKLLLRSEEEEESFEDWEPWADPVVTDGCHPTIIPFPNDTLPANPCIEYLLQTAAVASQFNYESYLAQKREEYKQMYKQHCMNVVETFNMGYKDDQYHYTLYYYDRAGNLVKTVPPHAVVPLTGTELAAVDAARDANTVLVPIHNRVPSSISVRTQFSLTTRYRYNSVDQPIAQETPDAGISTFYYDRLGRLAISQNAKQKFNSSTGNFVCSYTKYDFQSRIVEVGEMTNMYTPTGQAYINQKITYDLFFANTAYNAQDVTQTSYDIAVGGSFVQENLRSRISYTRNKPKGQTTFTFTDYYTYDIHGNVKSILHENLLIPAAPLQKNRIDYQYDLVSGNVNKVIYNEGKPDQYIHKYTYDGQNRIKDVYTSKNGLKYDLDARYFYYWHGPLSRVELGQNKVQGSDYAYTIQGWLKSVNSDAQSITTDPGHDGNGHYLNPNQFFARDAYGLSLHYFSGDYNPIEASYVQAPAVPGSYKRDLWNGNIAAINNTSKKPIDYSSHSLLQNYKYDQLNRITASTAFDGLDLLANTWNATATPLTQYATAYTYDAAGNIKHLARHGNVGPMDDLTYIYPTFSNQLEYVKESVLPGDYNIDIDDQAALNYTYDKIGNLVQDNQEKIQQIEWNAYGKVSKVTTQATSERPNLEFLYDAAGRRVMKKIIPKTAGLPTKSEVYVHDAQGNILTIYQYTDATSESPATYTVNEQMIYGSSRLGSWKSGLDLLAYIPSVPPVYEVKRGEKRYELNNHLSNVHTVISDRKKRICDNGVFAYNEADIRNVYDYYPFGMQMPGRLFNAPACSTVNVTTAQTVLYNDCSSTGDFTAIYPGTVSADPSGVLNVTKILAILIPDWGTKMNVNQTNGVTYTLSFNLDRGICNGNIKVRVKNSLGVLLTEQTFATGGSKTFTYTANNTGLGTIEFIDADGGDKCTFTLDEILVTEPHITQEVVCDEQECFDENSPIYQTLFQEDFNGPVTDWIYVDPSSTATVSGGQLQVNQELNFVGKFFTAEIGTTYRITVDVNLHGCSSTQAYAFAGAQSLQFEPLTSSGIHTFEWTAPDTDGGVGFFIMGCSLLTVNSVLVETLGYESIPCPAGTDPYRFGHNGQMKDNEIYGQNNSYTAEFWQYDPRLGRRWNIDPIVKPWRTPYDAFNNNPIIRVDPSGDDDYFNTKGQYLGSDGSSTNNVRVLSTNTIPENFYTIHKDATGNRMIDQNIGLYNSVALADITFNNMESVKVLLKGFEHYAKNADIDVKKLRNGSFSMSSAIHNGNSWSWDPEFNYNEGDAIYWDGNALEMSNYSKNTITIPLFDYKLNDRYNDKYNIINLMVHEKAHHKTKGLRDNYTHLEVFLEQVSHWSFKLSTEGHQSGTIDVLKDMYNAETRHKYQGMSEKENKDYQKRLKRLGMKLEKVLGQKLSE